MVQQTLLSLPYQLLIDGILYHLDARSLTRLRQASRACQQIADDELVWRRRIANDFNFPIFNSARISGWQRLYKGLSNPELYTWGDYGNDRIGREISVRELASHIWDIIARSRGVPFPLQIEWKGARMYLNDREEWDGFDGDSFIEDEYPFEKRIAEKAENFMGIPIQIYAGGWNFFALTDRGQILAWGTSSERQFESSIFPVPTMLDLSGNAAKSLFAGRAHAVALMTDDSMWEWSKYWESPISINIPHLFGRVSKDDVNVIHMDAGWDFTACLAHVKNQDDEEIDTISKKGNSTQIAFWKTDIVYLHSRDYIRSDSVDDSGNFDSKNEKRSIRSVTLPLLNKEVNKIAAGDNFILALTDDSEVYVCSFPAIPPNLSHEYEALLRVLPSPGIVDPEQDRRRLAYVNAVNSFYENARTRGQMIWKLLSKFSTDLRSSGLQRDGSNLWDMPELSHLVTIETKITHISAHFENFAVYCPSAGKDASSRGIVILGKRNNFEEPIVIPQLQGQQVIKVSQGDWHSGALTLDGRVLTWGEQSNGALGSWDALPVPENAHYTIPDPNRPPLQRTGIFGFFGSNPAPGDSLPQNRLNAEEIEKMVIAEKKRYKLRQLSQSIKDPLHVRFGFPKIGEQRQGRAVEAGDDDETKYVFDIAFAGWHSGALAIDRNLLA